MKIALPWRTWILFSYCFVLSFSGLGQNFHINSIEFDKGFERITVFKTSTEVLDTSSNYLDSRRVYYTHPSMRSDIAYYLRLLSSHQPKFHSADQIVSSTVILDIKLEALGYSSSISDKDPLGKVRCGFRYRSINGKVLKEESGLEPYIMSYDDFLEQKDFFDFDFQKDFQHMLSDLYFDKESYESYIAAAIAASLLSDLGQKEVPINYEEQAILKLDRISPNHDSQKEAKGLSAISMKGRSKFISGTMINDDHLITDARLFKTDKAYMFVTSDDSLLVELVRIDFLSNLALAKISNPRSSSLSEVKEDDFSTGKKCYTFGTPGSIDYQNTFQKITISNVIEYNGKNRIQLDGPAHIGFSGAPMYNEENELIGVIIASDFDDQMNLVFSGFSKSDLEEILKIRI